MNIQAYIVAMHNACLMSSGPTDSAAPTSQGAETAVWSPSSPLTSAKRSTRLKNADSPADPSETRSDRKKNRWPAPPPGTPHSHRCRRIRARRAIQKFSDTRPGERSPAHVLIFSGLPGDPQRPYPGFSARRTPGPSCTSGPRMTTKSRTWPKPRVNRHGIGTPDRRAKGTPLRCG